MSTFRCWGAVGWIVGVALALAGAQAAHRPPAPVLTMAGLAVCTFLIVAVGSGVVSGAVSLTFYHHLVAVLLVVGVWAYTTHAGVLQVLDLASVGIMGFLVFGRLGCLAVGCCHGRPRAEGVVYGRAHAAEGFPEDLVGVPLAPVQAWESAAAAVIVLSSLLLLMGDPSPGVTAAFVVGAYGAARFWLEMARGDPERPVWAGFSEAQWTSALLGCGVGVALAARIIPAHPALVVCAAAPASLAGWMLIHRRGRGERVRRDRGLPALSVHHYGLGAPEALPEAAARRLAGEILCARHPGCTGQLLVDATGEFHLLVSEPPPTRGRR
jgi:hypothetical protein